jgi:hypothetical protein
MASRGSCPASVRCLEIHCFFRFDIKQVGLLSRPSARWPILALLGARPKIACGRICPPDNCHVSYCHARSELSNRSFSFSHPAEVEPPPHGAASHQPSPPWTVEAPGQGSGGGRRPTGRPARKEPQAALAEWRRSAQSGGSEPRSRLGYGSSASSSARS